MMDVKLYLDRRHYFFPGINIYGMACLNICQSRYESSVCSIIHRAQVDSLCVDDIIEERTLRLVAAQISKRPSSLHMLRIVNCHIGRALAHAIRDSETIWKLDISHDTDKGTISLPLLSDIIAENRSIVDLDISMCQFEHVDTETVRSFADALANNKTITHINLGSALSFPEVLRRGIGGNGRLKHVSFSWREYLPTEAGLALAEGIRSNATLESVHLSEPWTIYDTSVLPVLEAVETSEHIWSLGLGEVCPEFLRAVIETFDGGSIRVLRASLQLEVSSMRTFADALARSTLRHLYIADTKLSAAQTYILSKGLECCSGLEMFHMNRCSIRGGVRHLANGIAKSGLHNLGFKDLVMRRAGFAELARGIKECATIIGIYFDFREALDVLIPALEGNPRIVYAYADHTYACTESLLRLAPIIRTHPSLRSLGAGVSNGCSEESMRLFTAAIDENPRLEFELTDEVISAGRSVLSPIKKAVARRRAQRARRKLKGIFWSVHLLLVAYRSIFAPGRGGVFKRARDHFEAAASAQKARVE